MLCKVLIILRNMDHAHLKEEGAVVRSLPVGRYYCRLGCDQDEI